MNALKIVYLVAAGISTIGTLLSWLYDYPTSPAAFLWPIMAGAWAYKYWEA